MRDFSNIFVVTLFLFLAAAVDNPCRGQIKKGSKVWMDSMNMELGKRTANGLQRIRLLNDLAYQYQFSDPSKGVSLAAEGIALAEKEGEQDLLARVLHTKAVNYISRGERSNAQPLLKKAAAIDLERNNTAAYAEDVFILGTTYARTTQPAQELANYQLADEAFRKAKDNIGIARTCSAIGAYYAQQGDFNKGLEYQYKALALFGKPNSKNEIVLAVTYAQMANAYFSLSSYDSAGFYLHKALAINKNYKNSTNLASTLNALGHMYRITADYPKAIEHLNASIEIWKANSNQEEAAGVMCNLAIVYNLKGENTLALQHYNQALSIAETANNKFLTASIMCNLTIMHIEIGNYDQALKSGAKTLTLCREIREPRMEPYILNAMGYAHSSLGNYVQALEYLHKALKADEALGDRNSTAAVLNSLGSVHMEVGDKEKAIEYYNKGLKIQEEVGDKTGASGSLGSIATIQKQSGEYGRAIQTARKALAIDTEIGNRGFEASHLTLIAEVLLLQGHHTEAETLFFKSKALADSIGNKATITANYLGLSQIYQNRGQLEKAIAYMQGGRQIAQATGNLKSEQDATNLLSAAHEKAGRYDSAYAYHKQYIGIRDSLLSKETQKQITRKEMQFSFDKKESDYLLKQQLDGGKLREQGQLMVINQQLLALRLKELALSNTEKDLQRLNYLQEKAEKQQKEMALSNLQLDVSLKERANRAERQQMLAMAKESKAAEKTRQTYMGAAFLIVLLLGTSSWIIISQRRKAGFQKTVSETEMKALRAQMNPHFIFNALNSVYRYLQLNERKAAEEYLMNFSQLTRLVLENSMQYSVTLEDELKALELYMGLESERLNKRFQFTIEVAESIDVENTLIPPLLLQPFVENSIWHGVTDEAKTGQINISINRVKNQLLCVIEDNGVGRSRINGTTDVLKKQKKSVGMSLTQQRIDIINKTRSGRASLLVKDLTDSDNKPAGLRIELSLPLELAS